MMHFWPFLVAGDPRLPRIEKKSYKKNVSSRGKTRASSVWFSRVNMLVVAANRGLVATSWGSDFSSRHTHTLYRGVATTATTPILAAYFFGDFMSRKSAVRLAQLEQMIRDLELADPAWQAAAAEYVQLQDEQQRGDYGVDVSDSSGQAEYVQPPAPWDR